MREVAYGVLVVCSHGSGFEGSLDSLEYRASWRRIVEITVEKVKQLWPVSQILACRTAGSSPSRPGGCSPDPISRGTTVKLSEEDGHQWIRGTELPAFEPCGSSPVTQPAPASWAMRAGATREGEKGCSGSPPHRPPRGTGPNLAPSSQAPGAPGSLGRRTTAEDRVHERHRHARPMSGGKNRGRGHFFLAIGAKSTIRQMKKNFPGPRARPGRKGVVNCTHWADTCWWNSTVVTQSR
jgi:hypothetical protein